MINLDRLRDYPVVAPDTETTGLHWYRDKCFGIALAVYDGKRVQSEYYDIREKPRVLEILAGEIPHCKRVVNHNMKFDSHFLREVGIRVPPDRIECTSVRAALIDENEDSFSLDALGLKHLGEGKVDIWDKMAKLFGGAPSRAIQIKNLHRAPRNLVAEYAAPDPALALRLWLWQEEQIKKQDLNSVWSLEKKLTPMLIEIEQNGIRVDEARAHRAMKETTILAATAQKELDRVAGKPINANSAPQMRALFRVEKRDDGNWYTDRGFQLEKTDGGEASTGKKSLVIMEELGDERAKHVMAIRKLLKAQQFLKDHILGHAVNGRVYPNYNQTRGDNELGTGTGRFSVDDPAMQQIPARDRDIAAIVRSCFLPEKGHVWCCADWEQFEFRWFAHYTKDPKIIAVYKDDPAADFHATVAEITGIPRNPRYAGDANAKQINLGLVFGMGRGEMAYQMGLDYTVGKNGFKRAGDKANGIFDRYHTAIPGVSTLLADASAIARARGYVRTAMGRHIRFPGGRSTHKAGGLVFQGTSADSLKQKMLELWPLCKEFGAKYLLSVHDEHDTSAPKKEVEEFKSRKKAILECFDGESCPIHCRVPILSSVASGPNWWEACK